MNMYSLSQKRVPWKSLLCIIIMPSGIQFNCICCLDYLFGVRHHFPCNSIKLLTWYLIIHSFLLTNSALPYWRKFPSQINFGFMKEMWTKSKIERNFKFEGNLGRNRKFEEFFKICWKNQINTCLMFLTTFSAMILQKPT
jgi:hypothetical protein